MNSVRILIGACHSQPKDKSKINSTGMELAAKLKTNQSSRWKNLGSEPLQKTTINKVFTWCAQKYPDREAICMHQGSRMTYKQVLEQVDDFAAGLLAIGLQKGDVVGIWSPNSVEWYVSFLAIMKAGMVVASLNPQHTCPEVKSALIQSDVKAIVVGTAWADQTYYDMLNEIAPEISSYDAGVRITTEGLPMLGTIIVIDENSHKGAYRWRDIFTLATPHHRQKLGQMQNEIDTYDICNCLYTSGSTGRSKAVMLTHNNLINSAYFTSKKMLLLDTKHHTICLQVPLFHALGITVGLVVAIHCGITLVLPSPKYSSKKTIEAIITEKCSVVYGTPTMYIDLINVVSELSATDSTIHSKLASLEIALTSAGFCSPELFRKMKKVLGFKQIYSAYGMTEAAGIVFATSPNDSESLLTSTVGSVLDHIEVKVIDDDGQTVPLGKPGELCFRGYNVMKGYYNNPKANEEVFLEGGWVRSGDIFILSDNGYGQIVGRKKDTIIRGGENIAPGEVEKVIITHPQVANVQVFAVSDQRLGEVVACSIVKFENNSSCNEHEIRSFCKGKLASYKIPKYITFVEDFPRTVVGKIQKEKLREEFERKLKLDEEPSRSQL